MWKFIGALIGFLFAGFIGAVVGYFFGWAFQNLGFAQGARTGPFANLGNKREQYFQTAFRLMGHVAKADGRISEQEIDLAQQLMSRMKLEADQKRRAIELFKEGADPDFNLQVELEAFLERCGQRSALANMLLVTLISTAFADTDLDDSEQQVLAEIAARLGFTKPQFEQLLGMVAAQQGFSQHSGSSGYTASGGASAIEAAYRALGVEPSIDDKALKRAYRKLISKHHPDKLIAQGVPQEMIEVATAKSQEIQSAYDLLEKHRKA